MNIENLPRPPIQDPKLIAFSLSWREMMLRLIEVPHGDYLFFAFRLEATGAAEPLRGVFELCERTGRLFPCQGGFGVEELATIASEARRLASAWIRERVKQHE